MLPTARDRFFPFYSLRNLLSNDFDHTAGVENTLPSVNITEDKKGYTIALAAPGMKRDDISVDLQDRILTIKGESKCEREEKDANEKNVLHREFCYSTFSRSFTLPEGINAEKVEANYADGILTVNVPKREPDPAEGKRSIKIK